MKISRILLASALLRAAPGVNEGFIGSTPITAIVHKADAEGAIQIDPITGNILTLQADRPEWAEKLTVAQISERHAYYQTALGDLYTAGMKTPEIMAYEDIAWLGVNHLDLSEEDERKALADDPNFDGFEHFELEASEEHRSAVVAEVLGIKDDMEQMEQDLIDGKEPEGALDLSAELLADNLRTQEELEALEESRQRAFGKVSNG